MGSASNRWRELLCGRVHTLGRSEAGNTEMGMNLKGFTSTHIKLPCFCLGVLGEKDAQRCCIPYNNSKVESLLPAKLR